MPGENNITGAAGEQRVLSYAPKPGRLRALAGIACILATLLLAAGFGIHFGPGMYKEWKYTSQWNRAMEFRLSPETVVYEEDPARARALMASANYHPPSKILLGTTWYPKPPAWWSPPACYTPRSLNRILPAEKDAVVWIHGRGLGSGSRFLTVVRCTGFDFGSTGDTVALEGMVYSRGTADTGPIVDRVHVDDLLILRLKSCNDHLRLFMGEPDPTDDAHFTITYELNATKGTIDCWVRETKASKKWVELKVRDGPAKRLITPF